MKPAHATNRLARRFLVQLWLALALAASPVFAESDCADGIDNDGNSLIDCLDPSCELQPCDDGVECSVGEACQASACTGGTADDSICDDAHFCNGTETCHPVLGCLPGTLIDCSAVAIGCAVGACDERADQCALLPVNANCASGLYCDGQETCDSTGDCQPGAPVDCSGLSGVCGTGYCDEAADACNVLPMNEGGNCDDGDPCTPADSCQTGACVGGGTTCGNGLIEVACGEECDPPSGEICDNLVDDDDDSLADCLDADCLDPVADTCGSGCENVSPCKTITRTKGAIRFRANDKSDVLKIKGRIAADPGSLYPVIEGFGLSLTSAGREVYRSGLGPGDLTPERRDNAYRFRDRSAKNGPGVRGGLFAVRTQFVSDADAFWYEFKVRGFADLSAATDAAMTLQVTGVDDVGIVTEPWRQRTNGWRLASPK